METHKVSANNLATAHLAKWRMAFSESITTSRSELVPRATWHLRECHGRGEQKQTKESNDYEQQDRDKKEQVGKATADKGNVLASQPGV